MGKSLDNIAKELKNSDKKVQLIYAFNGVGKTRLSRTFKDLVSPKQDEETNSIKVVYYNAFTEDLFYWDNDLDEDRNRRLKIHTNDFTHWVLVDEGKEDRITSLFQHYTNDKLSPRFNEGYTEVRFSINGGNDESIEDIKISRGEESCFVWCVFYSLIEEITEVLNISEPDERTTSQFDDLEYIFIDDPVSSLDENHLIELAVNISELIKRSTSGVRFIITTHNPLFYNVLASELNSKVGYLLSKNEDGTFELEAKKGDTNQSFSYHLFLKQEIERAIEDNSIQKYHFTLLRNLYEKTANFLGYPRWSELLPEDRKIYYNRIIQFSSHSTLSNEAVAEPTSAEKEIVRYLLNHLVENRYWKKEEQA